MTDRLAPLLITPRAFVRRHLLARVLDLPSPLAGQIVMITGASSGVGEAAAIAVGQRGATVIAVARRAEELNRVQARIQEAGGRAVAYVCDLTDAAAVDALVEQVLADHGHVDVLVNNAGRSIRRSLAYSYDRMHDFERTMAVNYFGPVRLILGLMGSMRERKSGHVVNVVTWGVQIKAPRFAAYIASKTALDSFSRIAGREAFTDNVTFTNLRLSLVRTDMIAATDAYENAPALTPEQAAALIVRACEDRPLTINTAVGSIAEVFNLLAPRLMDAIASAASSRVPDSAAARGETASGSG